MREDEVTLAVLNVKLDQVLEEMRRFRTEFDIHESEDKEQHRAIEELRREVAILKDRERRSLLFSGGGGALGGGGIVALVSYLVDYLGK